MLVLVAGVQAWLFLAAAHGLRAWAEGYQNMEVARDDLDGQETFHALGQEWAAPLPRVDYGAYYQKNRDAEALCIVARKTLSPADVATFRCD